MPALEDELLKQRFVPNTADADLSARLIRAELPSRPDSDILALIAEFESSDPPLNNDIEKRTWLNNLIGVFSQAKKSNLPVGDIIAVFQFLGSGVYPFLRRLNNGGVGGLSALPADQAVLLVHSLKTELTATQIEKLVNDLLLRFPDSRPACKQAIDTLHSPPLSLSGPTICQIVVQLNGIKSMDDIPANLPAPLNLNNNNLRGICACLKIAPPTPKEVRYTTCLQKAKAATPPPELNSNMVCVMYDAALRAYFTGFNQAKRSYEQGHIPAAIWNNIPEKTDPDFYKFGRGCAEVHCISQAFATRNTAGNADQTLQGCVFASFHPKEGKERPACAGCNQWLTPTGAFFKNSA
jgi:hypothetical protein